MNRGEIWFADLSPTRGSEITKSRPVLIVSNDANNRDLNLDIREELNMLTINIEKLPAVLQFHQ